MLPSALHFPSLLDKKASQLALLSPQLRTPPYIMYGSVFFSPRNLSMHPNAKVLSDTSAGIISQMIEVSDEQFEDIVAKAMDSFPKQLEAAKNVGIVIADEPTPEQRTKLELRNNQTLFGLYEGIPLTQRTGNYSGVLPDKITIFKNPMLAYVSTIAELKEEVHHTLWHELAHHFGLGHNHIEQLE